MIPTVRDGLHGQKGKFMSEISNAQLYWDDSDVSNVGWYLRYYSATGVEQGFAVDGDQNASTERLAAAIKAEYPNLGDGKIKVLRGEQQCGCESITFTAGVTTYRAL